MLCFVGLITSIQYVIMETNELTNPNSYDLDLDNKLSEETTTLVENYTVSCTQLIIIKPLNKAEQTQFTIPFMKLSNNNRISDKLILLGLCHISYPMGE